jgi:hypothetical protein
MKIILRRPLEEERVTVGGEVDFRIWRGRMGMGIGLGSWIWDGDYLIFVLLRRVWKKA